MIESVAKLGLPVYISKTSRYEPQLIKVSI